MHKRKQGQSWSIDAIIGVIIFILVIAIFYGSISSKTTSDVNNLEQDAKVLTSKLGQDDNTAILEEGTISKAKLTELCDKPYEQVKKELNIQSDFCIYIEDENGNIIPCGTNQKSGIGNGQDVQLSDSITCGDLVT